MPDFTRRTLLTSAVILSAGGVVDAVAQDNVTNPIEGKKGGTILGPRNPSRNAEDPDFLQPPATDNGAIPNLRFSFADTHVKMREGGWSREVTQRELPVATTHRRRQYAAQCRRRA